MTEKGGTGHRTAEEAERALREVLHAVDGLILAYAAGKPLERSIKELHHQAELAQLPENELPCVRLSDWVVLEETDTGYAVLLIAPGSHGYPSTAQGAGNWIVLAETDNVEAAEQIGYMYHEMIEDIINYEAKEFLLRATDACIERNDEPANMMHPQGPKCGCGNPSAVESGACAVCYTRDTIRRSLVKYTEEE